MDDEPTFRVAETVCLRVAGVPVTQGSKQGFVVGHRVVMKESGGDRLKAWRYAVNDAARQAYSDRSPWSGPVLLDVRFSLPKPVSAPKRKRTWPIKPRSGDVDKLARAVLDALTGVAFSDDSQVIVLVVGKDWALNGWTGVEITVNHLA